jgi:hypothetical protein
MTDLSAPPRPKPVRTGPFALPVLLPATLPPFDPRARALLVLLRRCLLLGADGIANILEQAKRE